MSTPAAKPFLKWAGGKSQLTGNIIQMLPPGIAGSGFTYIEPFVGGGAVLFHMLSSFPNIKRAVINDINADLINAYKTIAHSPRELIKVLSVFEKEFHKLYSKPLAGEKYYYAKRTLYNTRSESKVVQAALFIFLNRTCYNGLYRVNKSNEFNVPMGRYKNPMICDEKNILAISHMLQKVEILCGDYEATLKKAGKNTFFYFDPPYKPLTATSSFNSYAKDVFDDAQQRRLNTFCNTLHAKGHTWLLSNSDVGNEPDGTNFFDDLYSGFSITRVEARRSINSKPDKRHKLSELLISNY